MPESIGLEAVMDMGAFNRAQSQYMGALDKMDAGTSGVAKAISGAMKGIAVGIGLAGAALVGVGSLAFKSGMAMDEAFDALIIKTGASGKALEGMKADVNAVFTSIPTDVGKAADVVAEFARTLDYTGKGAQELSKSVLEASRLMGGDAANNAAALADVTKSWGIANDQAAGTMDKLFKAAQASGVPLDRLMQQLKLSGPQLRGMGFSLDESVAMLAKWEKAGLNSQQMLVTLRTGMADMAKDTGGGAVDVGKLTDKTAALNEKLADQQHRLEKLQSAKKVDAYAVEKQQKAIEKTKSAITDYNGQISAAGAANAAAAGKTENMRDKFMEAMTQIKGAKDETSALRIGMEIFGSRGAVMVEAIRNGNMAFEDMQAVLGDSTGAIMAASEATMDFPEKWTMVKNKMTAALAPIGMSMMDVVGTALDVFGPGMQKAAEWLGGVAGQISLAFRDILGAVEDYRNGNFGIWELAGSIAAFLGFPEDIELSIADWVTTTIEDIQGAITTIRESLAAFAEDDESVGVTRLLTMLGIPSDIAATIGGWVETAVTAVQGAIATIKTALWGGGEVAGAGGSAGDATATFLLMLGLPVDIASAVGDIVDDMATALQEGLDTLRGMFGGGGGSHDVGAGGAGGGGFLSGLFDISGTINQAKEDLIIGLAELGQTILDNIGKAFPDTKPYIDTIFTPLLDTFKTVIITVNDMKAQLGPVFAELWEKAGPPLEKLAKDLFPALNKVIQAAIPIVGKIIEVASKIIADVLPVAIDLLDKIVVFIGEKMPQIQSIITKALDLIQAVWDKVWPTIQTTVEVVWDLIKVAIDTALNLIEDIINIAMDLLSGDWDKAWEDFKKLVSDAWDGIKKIVGELAEGIQKLADDLEEIFGGINDTLETWKEEAIKKVKEFPEKAVEAIEKFANDFAKAGENLVGGLIDGIKAKASTLIEAAKKVVTDAIDAAKAAVGIHSHSTVGKAFGADLMGGVEDGIVKAGTGVGDALMQVSEYFMMFAQSVTPAQAKTMKDVASAFKDMGKGVDELVGSFAKLYEMGEGGMLAGNTFPTLEQITAALDQFLAIADVLMARIQGVIDAIGYDKIHKLRLTARRLSELISVLLIDLSPLTKKYIINFAIFDQLHQAFLHAAGLINQVRAKFSDKMLTDMTAVASNIKGVVSVIEIDVSKVVPSKNPRWMADLALLITQIQALVDAVVGWLGDMTQSARNAIAQGAKNAALIKELYTVLISPADVIKPYASKTWQAELALTVEQIAALVTELAAWLGAITGDALDVLTNAAAAADAMKGVLDIIKPGVDALTAVGTYVSAALLPEALEQFENDLVMAMRVLARIATQMNYEAITAAVDIFEAAQKVLGIVKPAVDALAAIGTYESVQNLDGVASAFSVQIEMLINRLVQMSKRLNAEAVTAAAEMATSITAILNLIKPAVDILAALVDYPSVSNIDGVAFALATQINILVIAFMRVNKDLSLDGLKAASEIFAAMRGIVDFIKPAIDMLTALAAYEETTDLMNQADRLANGLMAVIPSLQHAFDRYNSEGIPAASELYGAMKGIVDFVKPAIDMLTALAAYEETTDLMNQADRLANGLMAVIPSLQHAFDRYDSEGTAAASGFYNAAKGIIDFIKPGIDAITALATFAAVADLPKRMTDFAANLKTVIDALKDIGDDYDIEGLAAARLFGDAAKDIVGMVGPGISALEALLKYESGDVVAALALFKADFRTLVTGLAAIAYDLLGTEGLDIAIAFKDVADAIAQTCKSGVEAIATLGAATTATGTNTILQAFAEGVKTWLAAAVTNVKAELAAFKAAFASDLPVMVQTTYNYGYAAGQAMLQGWRAATQGGFVIPSLPSNGGGYFPVSPSSTSSSVTVNFGGVNISNGMDQTAFENRVLQVVSAAVGR